VGGITHTIWGTGQRMHLYALATHGSCAWSLSVCELHPPTSFLYSSGTLSLFMTW